MSSSEGKIHGIAIVNHETTVVGKDGSELMAFSLDNKKALSKVTVRVTLSDGTFRDGHGIANGIDSEVVKAYANAFNAAYDVAVQAALELFERYK